jgi:hypothetical protein
MCQHKRRVKIMLVRIIKAPTGVIDGFDMENLKVGSVYDLPTSLASLLIVDGYGMAEMRRTGESSDRGKRERSSNNQEHDELASFTGNS